MTTRNLRSVAFLAGCLLSLRAAAHEVDCSNLAAVALTGSDGTPILDPAGVPSLAAPPVASLVVDHYPALVAFDVRVRNLAPEPSVLEFATEGFLLRGTGDADRIQAYGAPLEGTIPVGGEARRLFTVPVRSYDDCVARFATSPDPGVCAASRENPFQVITETDHAECRARVVCGAETTPPPPTTCTAPSWTGVIQLPPPAGVTVGHGVAAGCDGATYASALNAGRAAPAGEPPAALLRFDPSGVLTATFRSGDFLSSLQADPSGGVVVLVASGAGGQLSDPGNAPWSVRKFDRSLAQAWAFPIAAAGRVDLGVDASSNVYLEFQRTNAAGDLEVGVQKLSPSGALVWDTTYATTSAAWITVGPDGTVYLSGVVGDPGPNPAPDQHVFVARLDTDGHLVSDARIFVPGTNVLNEVVVDPATGRVAVVGRTTSPLDGLAHFPNPLGFAAVWDAAGTPKWVALLRPDPEALMPAADIASSASQAIFDASGALWVGGFVENGTFDPTQPVFPFHQALVARYDATGARQWVRQFPWGDTVGDSLADLRIDPAGHGLALVNIHTDLNDLWTRIVRIGPDGT